MSGGAFAGAAAGGVSIREKDTSLHPSQEGKRAALCPIQLTLKTTYSKLAKFLNGEALNEAFEKQITPN
jgi:hypothetical protein